MTSIILNNIDVHLSGARIFSSKKILNKISFELEQGDRLALIGPNGAGKSTLLQTISGVLPSSHGDITVEGKVSALFNLSLGVRRSSTGRRNLILRGLIEGRSMKEINEKLPEMIAFADIGDAIDDPMETYSQGMAMRVIFAAATAFNPDILLLDEWLGVGDMAFREKSDVRMKELIATSGIIVLATHHQRLSRSICNKGLYIVDGEVRAFASVDEAWDVYLADGINRAPIGL